MRVHVGQPGRERARRRRRGRVLDRDPGAERRAGRRAGARHPGAAPLGRARRARRDPAHDRGGRLARQDHDVVDARAHAAQRGLAAELRDRRRGQRGRRQRGVRRRASGSSSRPTRATARSCGSGPRPRSSPASSPTTSTTTAGSTSSIAAFERFVDACPARSCAAPTTLVAARIAAARPRVRTYGFDPAARLPDRRRDARRRRRPVHARPPVASDSASSSCRSR